MIDRGRWIVTVLIAAAGCAQGERVGTIDHNKVAETVEVTAEVSAALVRIDAVDASLAELSATVGTLTIGGGGDSVTAWMYAGIVGMSLLSMVGGCLLYALGWRPFARRGGRRAAE